MPEYLSIFLISLASSFHCVGMCGGIAGLQAGWGDSSASRAVHLSLYHFGKIASYVFIGAIFGAFGALLIGFGRLLSLLAGSFMIGMALKGRFYSARKGGGVSAVETLFLAVLCRIKSRRGLSASLSLGLLNGLLPCSLVYAFAAKAAGTGSVAAGIVTMASFGLGTVPALLFSTQMIRSFSPALRGRFVSAGAFFIFILGMATLLRGFVSPSLHSGHGY
jgi:sulfite exporter TauE/SafE